MRCLGFGHIFYLKQELIRLEKNLIEKADSLKAQDIYLLLDTTIPYITMKKGYKIRYAEKAMVYVKNPTNLKDFVKQKIRTGKAHEALEEYAPFFPKVKSFKNEVKHGTLRALRYPRTLKEYFWTSLLFLTRLYIWIRVKIDEKILNKRYGDAWERIESTR